MSQKFIINITGAASGFGALAARALAKQGHTVFAGLKSMDANLLEDIQSFNKENNTDLRPLNQDMLSDSSVAASVAEMLSQTEHIDVVVHNCGHMVYGPLEAFTTEQLAEQYDINVLSTHRLNRAVLPHMRQRKSGLLVWVSSSSVHGAVPSFIAPYFAAKAGMDALASSFELELSQWGIESCIVVPGAYSQGTNHFATAGRPRDEQVANEYRGQGAPYEGMEEAIGVAYSAFEPADADVKDVAEAIVSVIESPHGSRPRRIHIDPAKDGSEIVSQMRDRLRKDRLKMAGFEKLFTVRRE